MRHLPWGPLLTDQSFHNTGVPPRDPASPDRGRAKALPAVLDDEFNCLGAFSDAPPERCQELRFLATGDARMEGAFKTPSLRGVALRAPYMHAGQLGTLEDVIAHYVAAPDAPVGRTELGRAHAGSRAAKAHGERAPIVLSAAERRDLEAFLRSLSPE